MLQAQARVLLAGLPSDMDGSMGLKHRQLLTCGPKHEIGPHRNQMTGT